MGGWSTPRPISFSYPRAYRSIRNSKAGAYQLHHPLAGTRLDSSPNVRCAIRRRGEPWHNRLSIWQRRGTAIVLSPKVVVSTTAGRRFCRGRLATIRLSRSTSPPWTAAVTSTASGSFQRSDPSGGSVSGMVLRAYPKLPHQRFRRIPDAVTWGHTRNCSDIYGSRNTWADVPSRGSHIVRPECPWPPCMQRAREEFRAAQMRR